MNFKFKKKQKNKTNLNQKELKKVVIFKQNNMKE